MPNAQEWSDAVAIAKAIVEDNEATYVEVLEQYEAVDEGYYSSRIVGALAAVLANFLLHYSEDVEMSVEDVCSMILLARFKKDLLGGPDG